MDTEQQIRLNFLDEAEEYFDRIESNLLGLADSLVDPHKVDLVLRSAHSIKGGAAMMSLNTISQVAHRLEDFLKILRVRYTASTVDVEVETLLLQSVDYLRHLGNLSRQELTGTNTQSCQQEREAIDQRVQTIFAKLQKHLGDLQDSDENALLAQDEDVNPALLIFEEGVDEILDRFEERLPNLDLNLVATELAATAQELMGFGNMANLESFTQLCESVRQQATLLETLEMPDLAGQALKTWRRSHALVLRGSIEKLPDHLENFLSSPAVNFPPSEPIAPVELLTEAGTDELLLDDAFDFVGLQSAFDNSQIDSITESEFDPLAENNLDLDGLQSAFNNSPIAPQSDVEFDPLAPPGLDLDSLQSAFNLEPEPDFDSLAENNLNLEDLQSAFDPEPATEFDPLAENNLNLEDLQSAFDPESAAEFDPLADNNLNLESLQSAFDPLAENNLNLKDLQSAFDPESAAEFDPLAENNLNLEGLQSAFNDSQTDVKAEPAVTPSPTTPTVIPADNPTKPPARNSAVVEQMVRVPASQLKQFNSLFEQLVLNRNSINLRLQQFQNIIALMSQRISQMELSNSQLKQWYDSASLEGVLSDSSANLRATQNIDPVLKNDRPTTGQSFDALERDRYSDIHLICQEQIETIVQLQEVATDVELGLQEIEQATRELNYTTKSMQVNVTRTQMLPFARVVRRFPRVIRDLNLQFNKQVQLKVIGESTLLDRSFIDALADPLMHLLRNAFDHGIEDAETRTAVGKPALGTITIQASNQGTYTVISVSDDGGGIPIDKISDRLKQMGFSQSEIDRIPEAELLDFIFDPGFSTAKKVTELSGRGVGMDVVRTNLQEIRGDVRVTTKPGKGSTFTLKVPFTLSILRVAIVEQAGIIFALPIDSIRELVPLNPELVTTQATGQYLSWNQTEIPLVEIEQSLIYHRLHSSLNLTGNPAINQTMAIVIEDEDYCAAIQISRFWHEQESTTRVIDSPIPLPPGIISSVVFGDGKVIPLIDPVALLTDCLSNRSRDRTSPTDVLRPSVSNTVLVVDDSINVRRYLSLTLEKAGYQTEQAKDGQEAVDKLFGGLTVDAVICDIEMPRLDGYGVLEEIKQRSEFADLPIAMLTSRSNEKHRKLAINLGASAYFSKPYNERQLLEKLSEMIEA